jgi:hypothetical protein
MTRTGHKDLAELREGQEATTQVKMSSGVLKELTGKHKVTIHWNLNEEAIADQIFMLRVDEAELYLDKQDLLRHLRFI